MVLKMVVRYFNLSVVFILMASINFVMEDLPSLFFFLIQVLVGSQTLFCEGVRLLQKELSCQTLVKHV